MRSLEACFAPDPAMLKKLFAETRTIAVVGLSPNPARPSHGVASYLQEAGYRIVPVNPGQSELLGEKCYASLRDVPEKIDVVDVFRRSEEVPPVVDDAVAIGAKVVWMQDGVVHEAAARKALDAGLAVVMNRCMLRDHRSYAPGGRDFSR